MTPLDGNMKCVLKLLLVWFLARYLDLVPIAFNMIKPTEVKQVWSHGWFHFSLRGARGAVS